MGSTAQLLDPALWSDGLQASVGGLDRTTFLIGVLRILVIDFLLSGDNAVVIAMACRGLPPRQRFWGVIIGVTLAVMLRIVFTGIVAQLMQLPYLKLLGGLALIYIAAKLLLPDESDDDEVKSAATLWGAVRIVLVADVVMSLDNILPIAAAARGSLALLVIGLVGSIPLIIAGAAVVMALLERFPILVWAGAALLGWVAGEIIATDPVVSAHLGAVLNEDFAQHAETAAAGIGAALVLVLGGLARRLQNSRRRRARSAGKKVRDA